MPNFPPSSWLNERIGSVGKPVRLVYIGSISLNSFFLDELIDWLKSMNGMFSCDFYSLNAQQDAIGIINAHPGLTSFKGAVFYEELPRVLAQYDVGIVMYKILEKNMIYNAPNKLFEYLACGLDVWFSSTLLSSYAYETIGTYPKVISVDFTNLESFDYKAALSHYGLTYKKSTFVMEAVYEEFYKALLID
jgi:hypothetical protein